LETPSPQLSFIPAGIREVIRSPSRKIKLIRIAIADNEWLIGENQVLNPKEYFIVITALFGNGQSTSPSNSNIRPFPKVTFYDNVRAQHTLVTKHLGIKHARAVLGKNTV